MSDIDEFIAEALRSAVDPVAHARYGTQIHAMVEQGRKWLRQHPNTNPKVQFNYPPDMMLIGSLEAGIENGRITLNHEGCALVNAMETGMEGELTCFMLRVAMELVNDTRGS